jgi:hypothetical protein
VVARKLRADSMGREAELPMDDPFEIRVFAPGDDDGPGAPLPPFLHRTCCRGRGRRLY